MLEQEQHVIEQRFPDDGLQGTADPTVPETADDGTIALRVTSDVRKVREWALVLRSKGLLPVVRHVDHASFALHALRAEVARALNELDAFDAEERAAARALRADAAVDQAPPVTRFAAHASVVLAAALAAFFVVTGPSARGSFWFSAGASDAARVLEGEWWRTVTALTLHADVAHVLSNVGIGTLVVGAVMRAEGVGVGAALVLLAGTVGNVINAWAHQSLHRSVGFSTAVFGAIGILGGLSYVRGRRRVFRARPAWTAVGGSIALLALLGMSGERTDIFAHVFGTGVGLVLGLGVAWLGLRPRTTAGQIFWGLSALAAVAGAWVLALR